MNEKVILDTVVFGRKGSFRTFHLLRFYHIHLDFGRPKVTSDRESCLGVPFRKVISCFVPVVRENERCGRLLSDRVNACCYRHVSCRLPETFNVTYFVF